MKFSKENTIIVFGRSLFINEIKEYIPKLIEKFDTIGINSFYKSYPDVKYSIFKDKEAIPKEKIKSYIITDLKNKDLVIQDNAEFWRIETNTYSFSIYNDKLNIYYFTNTTAINWAYLKGYKNVILAGVDLVDNKHFDDINHRPIFDDDVQKKTIEYMEKICTKYVNLFQLNTKSKMKLDKTEIKEII